MTRKMNQQIRADAADHALSMSEGDLQSAIVSRNLKIKELEEALKYHTAMLVGYQSVAFERQKKALGLAKQQHKMPEPRQELK